MPCPDIPDGIGAAGDSRMKIGIQTWGSHGDIRPMLALAEGLRDSGHTVTLVITSVDHDSYRDAIPGAGVDIRMVASPVIRDPATYPAIRNTIFNERNPVRQVRHIFEKLFQPAEQAMMQAAQELCAENDLVIGHYLHHPLQQAAAMSGVPHVSVTLAHSTIPTSLNPPAGFPPLGRMGNALAWKLVGTVLNASIKRYPDRLRRAHGMEPAADLLKDVWSSRLLNLVAVSPLLCPRPADWPDSRVVCGFLDRPDPESDGQVPPELDRFLSRGEAPVFMTFGSVLPLDTASQRETLDILTEAANIAGCRAVIQAPDWRECGMSSTDTIHYARRLPHALVFPRCAAIVHHGGAGTTHAATLAGKPSVVVAHIAEQEFWAGRLREAGLSPPLLKRGKLTATALAKRIREATQSRAMREAAECAADRMKTEQGVRVAVTAIEGMSAGMGKEG